ncbi:MAG: hypothetical protein ABIQ95_15140, partial [Bdellovibrionia bacterium]
MQFKRISGKLLINLLLGTAIIVIPLTGRASTYEELKDHKKKVEHEKTELKKKEKKIEELRKQIVAIKALDSTPATKLGQIGKSVKGLGINSALSADCKAKCTRLSAGGGCKESDFKDSNGKEIAPTAGQDDKTDPDLCTAIFNGHLTNVDEDKYGGETHLDRDSLTPSCLRALQSCGDTEKLIKVQGLHLEIYGLKQEITGIKNDVLPDLEKETKDIEGNCVDCHSRQMFSNGMMMGGGGVMMGGHMGAGMVGGQMGPAGMMGGGMMGGMGMRTPSKGDYIVGGISALMPAILGGMNLGAFAMEQNAYSNNYTQYLGFCQQVGVPCNQPGYMGGFGYMGGPLGGMGMGG